MKRVPIICLIFVAIAVTGCSKPEEQTSVPAGPSGSLDVLNCDSVAGWVWIVPQTGSLKVDIIEAGKIVETVTANVFRPDLKAAGQGDGVHGFNVPLPSSLKDGHSHTISVKASGLDLNSEVRQKQSRALVVSGIEELFARRLAGSYHRLQSLDSAAGWLWAAAKRRCLGIGARIL
jgi:hypothetical protein